MSKGYDWNKIETEYITTNISQKKIAEKYNIPIGTIQDRARDRGWFGKRKTYHEKVMVKAMQKIEKNNVERIASIMRTSDKLVEIMDAALEDPDMFYKVLVENQKTGRLNTKKTKLFNTKRLKEMAGAIKDLTDVYKSGEDNSEDGNEITINIRSTGPVEAENDSEDTDNDNLEEYME